MSSTIKTLLTNVYRVSESICSLSSWGGVSLHPDLWEQTRRWDAAAGWRSLLPVSAWTVAGWPFYGPELHHVSYVTKILIRQVSLWQQLIRICWFWDETGTLVHPSQPVVSSVGDLKLIHFLFLKFCYCEQTLVLCPANNARALDGGPVSIWYWL